MFRLGESEDLIGCCVVILNVFPEPMSLFHSGSLDCGQLQSTCFRVSEEELISFVICFVWWLHARLFIFGSRANSGGMCVFRVMLFCCCRSLGYVLSCWTSMCSALI